ncbi:MAG: diguanylate cyclase [Oxalobacteraceae bacterium]|nr:MAG: diguanylate cyclase [Oxalobacteraceae bacterium]
MEQSLRRLANTDELTGLINRAGFNRAMSGRMATARKNDTPLTLLLIDLDGFKAVTTAVATLKATMFSRRSRAHYRRRTLPIMSAHD